MLDFKNAHKQAIPLTHFRADPFEIELLRTLEEIGFREPVLFGGALRDRYMGLANKIHDYDVCAHFGTTIDEHDRSPDIAQRLARHIEDLYPGSSIVTIGAVDGHATSQHVGTKIDFLVEGKLVSLYLSNSHEDSLKIKATCSDAPINGIAMGTDGVILAHKKFQNHSDERLYEPNNDFIPREVAQMRYEHLRQKIPGLKVTGLDKLDSMQAFEEKLRQTPQSPGPQP